MHFAALFVVLFLGTLHVQNAECVVIDNTRPKLDLDGRIVNAHDGTIRKYGDYYYYHGAEYGLCAEPPKYGCDQTADRCGFHSNHNVSIYKSKDLGNDSWERVGTAVQCTELEDCGILYRPHLVFNPLTKKYVLFVNYVGKDRISYNGNAVFSSDFPEGPFTLETKKMNLTRLCPGPFASEPCGEAQGGCGDFDVLVDPADGQAYIAYGCQFYMSIEKLTADFYNVAPIPSSGNGNATAGGKFGGSVFPDYFVEAPSFFERAGTYYLLYGHCCCFCEQGSGVLVYTAKHPMGPWIPQPGGDLACVSPSHETPAMFKGIPTPNQGCLYNGAKEISVTNAQQNFVIKVDREHGNATYVWTGDLWQQAPDGLKGHEGQFWYPLKFDSQGRIAPLKHIDSFTLDE